MLGVFVNPAGELAVHTLRKHLADMEELKTRIEDLKGARRGNVSITASQFLPFLAKVNTSISKSLCGF